MIANTAAPVHNTMSNKPKLLALDDEQDNLDLIQRSLRPHYDVITTTSAKDALSKFENHDFSVILSDQRMPEMSGTSFLEESLKRQPSAIRILITGYSDIESVIDAINKGAVHRYIKKPWTKEELQREISISVHLQKLVIENQEMVKLLQETNQKLKEQQNFLMKSLDERSKDLYILNSELQKLNEQLLGETRKDGLTGLYNHKTFQEKLREEIDRTLKSNGSLSVLFFDVDNFKHYNDNFGHQAGDFVLKAIADLLMQTSRVEASPTRESDLVARYGGEEFAVILPDTPIEGAKIKAERIRKSIADFSFPNMEKQPLGRISVSVGVSTLPYDANSAEQLIEHADTAMYHSKMSGRNCVTAYHTVKDKPVKK